MINDDVFDWDELPRSVAVFGPGVIGLELGQALHRLGVSVHMFGRGGPVGRFTDPRAARLCGAYFPQASFISTRCATRRSRAHRRWRSDPVRANPQELERTRRGRLCHRRNRRARPNVGRLGLENTSLAPGCTRACRCSTVATLQCGVSHIFIAGDASNDLPLLHEAADEGRIAGENAARFPHVQENLRRAPLAIVFTDPQLAVIGARYADLDATQDRAWSGFVRGPGTQPRDAAQPRSAACLRRQRVGRVSSARK